MTLPAYIFDMREGRRMAISVMLSRIGGAGVSAAEAEVPRDVARFARGLPSSWLVVLHAGNERSIAMIRALQPSVGARRLLVIFSGGDATNFNTARRVLGSSLSANPHIRLVPCVNRDWLEPLRAALLEVGLEQSPEGADIQALHGDSGARETNASPELREFEKTRAHVSHDVFTNGFCAPLGFHCTDADSPRRRDLLVWARSDRRWWKNLCGPASQWQDTRSAVESVLARASTLGASSPTGEDARAAMDEIDKLMAKFTCDTFENACLTDDEIDRFWRATDTIRGALQAVRHRDTDSSSPAESRKGAATC